MDDSFRPPSSDYHHYYAGYHHHHHPHSTGSYPTFLSHPASLHPLSTAETSVRNRHHDAYLTCNERHLHPSDGSLSTLDGNPPSASSSTSSTDVNPLGKPDLKVEGIDKAKVDVENKPPPTPTAVPSSSSVSGTSSQLTADKSNEFNFRQQQQHTLTDLSQENTSPLTIAVGGSTGHHAHLGPLSSSSSKARK